MKARRPNQVVSTIPVVGDKIYIPSAGYVYRGQDDVQGGLATIEKVEVSDTLPAHHINSIFIKVEEIPTSRYNYRLLMKEQMKLKKEFGDQVAGPDPDNRPEFNQPNADWK